MTKKYKDITDWAIAMRKDTKKELWNDWFNIGGHWYTCEEFDDSGKYMRYTSVTNGTHIDIETTNRYCGSWLTDAVVTEYAIEDLRFDISYYIADIKKLTRKEIMLLNIWLWDRGMYKEMRDLIDALANTRK